MMGAGGNFITARSGEQSRDSRETTHLRTADVRSSNPRHRDSLRTMSVFGCSRRTVLSVYRQPAVRFSTGYAGGETRRVSTECDTTTMPRTTNRPTNRVNRENRTESFPKPPLQQAVKLLTACLIVNSGVEEGSR